jgi:hypothetical protein
MRSVRVRRLLCAVLTAFIVLAVGASAGAETKIVEPTAHPYHVQLDDKGNPIAFTVVASGFTPNANVFIIQCDGRAASDPFWSPGRDCDAGTAPGAVSADAHGVAHFDAANPNQRVLLSVGQSPESIFNCVPAGAEPPSNGLRNFTTCQLRVSTNNAQATDDQVFLPIEFGGSSSGGSSDGWKVAVVVGGAVVLLIVLAVLLLTRRRNPAVSERSR